MIQNKWQKIELLKLWEGIYLLLHSEPNESELRKKRNSYGDYGNVHFWKEFKEIRKMAEASIKCYTLEVYTYDSDILYCELIPRTFFSWAHSKGYKVPKSLTGIIEEKSLSPQTDTNNKYIESGKLSGQVRAEKADDNWNEIKPKLLEIATKYKNNPISAHKIATIALTKGIITKQQVSNTGKRIREDVSFIGFIKKKK